MCYVTTWFNLSQKIFLRKPLQFWYRNEDKRNSIDISICCDLKKTKKQPKVKKKDNTNGLQQIIKKKYRLGNGNGWGALYKSHLP